MVGPGKALGSPRAAMGTPATGRTGGDGLQAGGITPTTLTRQPLELRTAPPVSHAQSPSTRLPAPVRLVLDPRRHCVTAALAISGGLGCRR
jgi:hypothetical protein